ncbi:thioesterase superfamily protein [Paludibacter propionicigenes WB4]|uniref:Thioesterase superfamily protein n=2 Tax=Paludibacter TaxID=346096 RepID=E4T4N7_PALPW|nr:thioesterase superfamily protein [Paludibacter propionicigenes WB4]
MPQSFNLEKLNKMCKNTMMEHLGIEFTEVSEGRLVAKMPIDERTIQPMKRLHGGATMALAESVGSAGSLTLVDPTKYAVLGVEISGSHVGATSGDFVIATGTIQHQGKTSHVWEIRVEDKNGKLISICRLTNRIIPIKSEK